MKSHPKSQKALYINWACAVLFLLSSSFVSAESTVETVKSSKASVDEAIKSIYISADEKNTSPDLKNLHFVPSLVPVETDAIEQALSDKSVPDSEKEIILVRYTLGDPRITDILIKAKNQGVKVTLMTDLNPVMTGNFSQIQSNFTSAFSKAKLKDPEKSPGAKVIQSLLDAGFEFKKDIISQPLYSSELERIPIMHEKSLLIRVGDKKTSFFGTANLAPNPRYNRMFQVDDDAFYDRYHAHIEALIEGYQKGKETKDIVDLPRTKIQYKDGTEMELAFTDGKYNPNDRIAELLRNNQLDHIDLSHFVITHREFLKALGESFSKNPKASGFAIADDRFSGVKGWGLAPALVGVDVLDPYNRKVTGLSPTAFSRLESYVYQRPAIDPETKKIRVERSEEGPPVARHVWHDKTTVIDFTDKDGKAKTSIFTGSFNLSNNVANSEFQVQINVPRDSWLNKAVKHSIQSVVKNEPEFAIPNLEASLRNAIALVLGITDLEIPIEKNRELFQASDKRDFEKMKKVLHELAEIQTQLNWKTPVETRKERVQQFVDFLTWYQQNIPPSHAELEVRTQRLIGIALVIAQPKLEDHLKANILSKVIDRPQLTVEQHHELLNGAFKQLGLGEVNPWSGTESNLFSIEEVVSKDILEAKKQKPDTSLHDLVQAKLDASNNDWKGPAFDSLVSTLESQRKASALSVISTGLFSPSEIQGLIELLNKNQAKAGLKNTLLEIPSNRIFDTNDTEKLEDRLRKLFLSQLKKGVISSLVLSSDPNLTKVLNRIKKSQEGDFADFKIQLPRKAPKDSQECTELLFSLGLGP